MHRRLATLEARKPEGRRHEWNVGLAEEVRRIVTDPTNRQRALDLFDRKPRLVAWAWQSCFGEPSISLRDAIAAVSMAQSHA